MLSVFNFVQTFYDYSTDTKELISKKIEQKLETNSSDFSICDPKKRSWEKQGYIQEHGICQEQLIVLKTFPFSSWSCSASINQLQIWYILNRNEMWHVYCAPEKL